MTGAEALIRTLLAGGVDTCFTNPGTSEIHVVAALDRIGEMRCVPGLFEGVVTAAADGYARMAEKPACTLLHLGPGFANGIANLHNARRAHVPMVNIIGQHAIPHQRHDTPLDGDIESIARPYSRWLRTSRCASTAGRDAAEAVTASRAAGGQIATLIVPADVSWSKGASIAPLFPPPEVEMPGGETVERAAAMLRSGLRTAILLSGNALYGEGLEAAGHVAAATGAKLFAPYPFTRLQCGAGLPAVERVHYILEQAKQQLGEFRQLILVGARAPVAYFAYPGKDSTLTPAECEILTLANADQNCAGVMEALAALLPGTRQLLEEMPGRPALPDGDITLSGLASAIGALLPENAIVVDESMTSGRGVMAAARTAPPHDWLGNTGGSIGIAMPLAVGAAVASPDRRVLCLSADGSGMYTLQALWTMAREGLKITTVVFANRAYAVLKREFSYLGAGDPGQLASSLFNIGCPDLDWVQLARGLGVPAVRATSLGEFTKALRGGFESGGPALIEVPL
ncbi:MAG: acetolactate synthase large subunit [Bryobacterales bacterium]|nr:acetolactate synthase large subunit [Bryobacterales bacterium]